MQKRSAGVRWLRHITATPGRMLSAGAALQILALIVASLWFRDEITAGWTLLPLTAALATLTMGHALEQVPERVNALPPEYPLYGSVFFLMTVGGLLIILDSPTATIVGLSAFLAGWIFAARSVGWKLRWTPGKLPRTLVLLRGLMTTVTWLLSAILCSCFLDTPAAQQAVAALALSSILTVQLLLSFSGR